MDSISLFLAFSAGLLSFLSPCVLPLVPAYISYLTGTSAKELKDKKLKLTTLYKSIGFVVGFSIIFVILGASATSLGNLLVKYKSLLGKIGGILIIVFGLHTLELIKINLFYHEKRFLSFGNKSVAVSSVFMGMAFATGWTPCIGPILSSILIYAANLTTVSKGVILLSAYSLGMSIPFIITAILIEGFLTYKNNINKFLPIMSNISGVLMIIMGILIFTNKVAVIGYYLNLANF